MRRDLSARALAFTALIGTAASAVGAQDIPVRTLSKAVRTSPGTISALNGIRHLRDGRVLVNDAGAQRLLVFDSTLTRFRVIAENAPGARNKYGTFPGVLMPYVADSTVLVDFDARVFVVIDPEARIIRTMAPPKQADVMQLSMYSKCGANACGAEGYDPKGRLVYRTWRFGYVPQGRVPVPDSDVVTTMVRHDSLAIVRGDPATHSVDTIAFLAHSATKTTTHRVGRISVSISATNPLPTVDEWTLLPDGTVAVVRSQDYHIDWVDMDGRVTSSPKMRFDWRRLTSEEKQQIIDSTKSADDARTMSSPKSPAPPPSGLSAAAGSRPSLPAKPVFDPGELPDFYPPIRAGQVKADPEGNVWLLPTTSRAAGGGLMFDVVNRNGVVFERVQLPPERNLVGFGPGGIVYMSDSSAPEQLRLERARVR